MNTKPNSRPWAEEELQLVAACWARGESAGEISSRLPDRSRGAVIAVVHRNGFKRNDEVARATAVAPLRTAARISPQHRKAALASYQATQPAPITLAGPSWSHPVSGRAA